MGQVEVSVCIITYMHEKYIRKALDSVFMQKTNFEFEVIVGEDASPDNTREILLEYKEKYGDKLVLVLQEKNIGASKNSRSLQKKIRGRYIASLEGDDFWTDEYKLQKQYDILEKNPQYSAVCSDYKSVSFDGKLLKSAVLGLKKDTVKTMKNWLNEGYSVHTCTIFRRNIFPINDERYIKLRTAEPTMGDIITFTLLYDAGDIYVLKDIMSAHRSAGNSDTSSFSYAQRTKSVEYTYMYMRIIRNIEKYLDYKYDLTPCICNRISRLKIAKLLGQLDYESSEMKKVMKSIPVKYRISVYYKMMRLIVNKVFSKIRSYT